MFSDLGAAMIAETNIKKQIGPLLKLRTFSMYPLVELPAQPSKCARAFLCLIDAKVWHTLAQRWSSSSPEAMKVNPSRCRTLVIALTCACTFASLGCGGRSGISAMKPITVYLPISTVVIMPGAASVTVPIQIGSSSETALVSVGGLPAGVGARYASSDTNPSGSLTFSANTSAMTGTYMPNITVMSSGQTVSTGFTLIVKAS